MRRLIGSEDARSRSALERRFTDYLVVHGIRGPDGRNETIAHRQADCIYHEPPLVIELDSRAHHQRRAEMAADRRRDRAYRRAGYTPIRVVWEELDPAEDEVATELLALVGGVSRPAREHPGR